MSAVLTTAQRDGFLALLEGWKRAEERGRVQHIAFHQGAAAEYGGLRLIHAGWGSDDPRAPDLTLTDLHQFEDSGMIDVEWRGPGSGNFRITVRGREYARRVRDAEAAEGGTPQGPTGEASVGLLGWHESVLPVLQAVYGAYSARPSDTGISQAVATLSLDGTRVIRAPARC